MLILFLTRFINALNTQRLHACCIGDMNRFLHTGHFITASGSLRKGKNVSIVIPCGVVGGALAPPVVYQAATVSSVRKLNAVACFSHRKQVPSSNDFTGIAGLTIDDVVR